MTRSQNSWRSPSPAIVALTALLLAGCAAADLKSAGIAKGEAAVVGEALELARPEFPLPALPGDCTGRERSGVREGQRLDEALVRTDAALARANDRVRRCADWYSTIRSSHKGGR